MVDGVPQPWSKTHEAFKNHLENKQWAAPAITPEAVRVRDARPHLHDPLENEPLFTMSDLEAALQKLKKKKAAGPDEIPNEVWLLLDETNLQTLLDLYTRVKAQTRNRQTIVPFRYSTQYIKYMQRCSKSASAHT